MQKNIVLSNQESEMNKKENKKIKRKNEKKWYSSNPITALTAKILADSFSIHLSK